MNELYIILIGVCFIILETLLIIKFDTSKGDFLDFIGYNIGLLFLSLIIGGLLGLIIVNFNNFLNKILIGCAVIGILIIIVIIKYLLFLLATKKPWLKWRK